MRREESTASLGNEVWQGRDPRRTKVVIWAHSSLGAQIPGLIGLAPDGGFSEGQCLLTLSLPCSTSQAPSAGRPLAGLVERPLRDSEQSLEKSKLCP